MKRISLTDTAQALVSQSLKPGAIAIDATLGNGHDALFLAQTVGEAGRVYGFDIQPAAIAASAERLHQHGLRDRATLIQASHAEMAGHVPAEEHGLIGAVMFNLGYLPGADKNLITQSASTLQALEAACRLLAPGGIVTILVYPGHAGGDLEAHAVEDWLQRLDSACYRVDLHLSVHPKPGAPKLFAVYRTV